MTYFYVSKIGGGKPTVRHLSYGSALQEAKRLVDQVGGEYEILQAVSLVKAAPKYMVSSLLVVCPPKTDPYPNTIEDDLPF